MKRIIAVFTLIIALALTGVGCSQVRSFTESQPIAFKTIKKNDTSLLDGETRITRAGEAGVKTVVFEDIYKWGKKTGRRKVKETVVIKPINEIIKVGTSENLSFTVDDSPLSLKITIKAGERRASGYSSGTAKINSDALIIKGTIQNKGETAVSTSEDTELAIVHPNLDESVVFLPTTEATILNPNESRDMVWAVGLNGDTGGTNEALAEIGDIKVVPRALTGPGNEIQGELKTLAGLPAQ